MRLVIAAIAARCISNAKTTWSYTAPLFRGMRPSTPPELTIFAMNHAETRREPSNQSLSNASSENDKKNWCVSGLMFMCSEAGVQSLSLMVRYILLASSPETIAVISPVSSSLSLTLGSLIVH